VPLVVHYLGLGTGILQKNYDRLGDLHSMPGRPIFHTDKRPKGPFPLSKLCLLRREEEHETVAWCWNIAHGHWCRVVLQMSVRTPVHAALSAGGSNSIAGPSLIATEM
jgi:hypothetical protein